MDPILTARGLVKNYPGVQAVRGLSLAIRPGICFGLLGPNGAGKTTTIEIIEGITPPDSGDVFYKGEPIGKRFRLESGIQFQSTSLQDYLTVREVLEMFAAFYPKTMNIHELSDLCSLGEFLNRDAKKLSGGQRQRVLVALALVNDPDIVFLDEPTTGLDPQARHNFWDLVRKIRAANKTIVLTTHYMDEAYALCDEIAIMDRGQIIAQGHPNQLLKDTFNGVSIHLPKADFAPPPGFPWPTRLSDESVEILTTEVNSTIRLLMEQGVALEGLQVKSRTLEDLFLQLTGKALRN